MPAPRFPLPALVSHKRPRLREPPMRRTATGARKHRPGEAATRDRRSPQPFDEVEVRQTPRVGIDVVFLPAAGRLLCDP